MKHLDLFFGGGGAGGWGGERECGREGCQQCR